MTNYYIDAAQVGGNGLSPNSAFASLTSVPWAAGDRAWMRQTHQEIITRSTWIGPSFAVNNWSRLTHLIGWPTSSLDPFWSERPIDGRSAGWDADLPATFVYSVYGLKMPLLVGSSQVGFIQSNFCIVANMAYSNSGGANTTGPAFASGTNEVRGHDNIAWFFAGGPITRWQTAPAGRIGKLTLVVSGSNASGAIPNDKNVNHLVIHSLSVWSGGLIKPANNFSVGVLENQSNSIDYMFDPTGSNWSTQAYIVSTIRAVVGIQPYSGAVRPASASGNNYFSGIGIDDYYGQGPRIIGGAQGDIRITTAVEAYHAGRPSMIMQVQSVAANIQRYGPGVGPDRLIAMKKHFDVVSGTPITIRIPFYVSSTNIMSLSAGNVRAMLDVRGKNADWAVQSNVLVGSAGMWTGSLCAGGFPLYFDATFYPTETRNKAVLNVEFPWLTQATSGQPLNGYILMGEPY